MTKDRVLIFLIAFAGALAGANVQPILTGAGKILFPENAVPATISASGGALTVAAGGVNQNVNLTPSGSGFVQTLAALNLGATVPFTMLPGDIAANRGGASPGSGAIFFGSSVAGNYIYQDTSGNFRFINSGSEHLRLFASGGISLGSTTDPGSGVSNAATGYSVAGVPGVGGSISVSTASATGVNSVSPSTGSALTSAGCTSAVIQYKDWAGANQSLTVCLAVTSSSGTFVTSVSTGTTSFLTSATASTNSFSGGIRTN